MTTNLLLFSLFGVLMGIVTGLTPGLHINTIAVLIIGIFYNYNADPLLLSVFILGMSITHTISDFIPSVFLGVPDPDTALSILPAHQMLLEGRGYEALVLTVVGGIIGLLILLFMLPFSLIFLSKIYASITPYLHIILITIMFYIFLIERKRIRALFVFLLSGMFGMLILNTNTINQNFVLFPVFTGLFGISMLLLSFKSASKIPKQELDIEINNRESLIGSFAGFLGGLVAGVIPALGSSQSAFLIQELGKIKNARCFLIIVGTINTISILYSIISIYLVGGARSGSAIAIQKMLGVLEFNTVILFVGLGLLAAGFAGILTLNLGKKIIKFVHVIKYNLLIKSIIGFLLILTYILTGLYGLLILTTATAIGLVTNLLGVRKTFAMGVLLLPTILYFAGLNYVVIRLFSV